MNKQTSYPETQLELVGQEVRDNHPNLEKIRKLLERINLMSTKIEQLRIKE